VNLVDLVDQAGHGVRYLVHVHARREGVEADGVKLVAVLGDNEMKTILSDFDDFSYFGVTNFNFVKNDKMQCLEKKLALNVLTRACSVVD
jgi:hypothetical protein